MKNTLLFLILSFYSLTAFAQAEPFLSEAKEWTYCMIVGNAYSQTGLLYSQVIEGVEQVNGLDYYRITNSEVEDVSDAGLIREDGQRIYFIPQDSTEEVLLYDFGVEVGDSIPVNNWLLSLPGYEHLVGDYLHVISIDTIMSYTGEALKSIYLEGDSNASGARWIEQIGDVYGSFTRPRMYPAPDYDQRPNLICVQENGNTIYEKTMNTSVVMGPQDSYGCGGLLSSTEEHTSEIANINLYPNPFTTKLYIDNAQAIEELSIYSTTGQLISVLKTVNSAIDLSHLDKGVYFIELKTKEGRSYRHIVKS